MKEPVPLPNVFGKGTGSFIIIGKHSIRFYYRTHRITGGQKPRQDHQACSWSYYIGKFIYRTMMTNYGLLHKLVN